MFEINFHTTIRVLQLGEGGGCFYQSGCSVNRWQLQNQNGKLSIYKKYCRSGCLSEPLTAVAGDKVQADSPRSCQMTFKIKLHIRNKRTFDSQPLFFIITRQIHLTSQRVFPKSFEAFHPWTERHKSPLRINCRWHWQSKLLSWARKSWLKTNPKSVRPKTSRFKWRLCFPFRFKVREYSRGQTVLTVSRAEPW